MQPSTQSSAVGKDNRAKDKKSRREVEGEEEEEKKRRSNNNKRRRKCKGDPGRKKPLGQIDTMCKVKDGEKSGK